MAQKQNRDQQNQGKGSGKASGPDSGQQSDRGQPQQQQDSGQAKQDSDASDLGDEELGDVDEDLPIQPPQRGGQRSQKHDR